MCVRAWEAILKFLEFKTGLTTNTLATEEQREMHKALDRMFSKQPDCQGCSLNGYLEFAQSQKKWGVDLLALNLDYIRDPYLVQADIHCTQGSDSKALAFTSEEIVVSDFNTTGSLQQRVIEPEIRGFRDELNEHPELGVSSVTIGRVTRAIQQSIHDSFCQCLLADKPIRNSLLALCSMVLL